MDVRYRSHPRGLSHGLVAACLAAGVVAAGCSSSSLADDQCSAGEYPAKAVGIKTGGVCVTNGHKPPAGYVRYPAGKVPKKVGDKWDTYWKKVVVDKNGHLVGKSKNVPQPK